ncbi:histidine phosphatase family protein [Paenibacillus sp. TRM 82003]|nr:histidine phosphatase family protein [Paenibacillus sp. TRM 82003]
MRIGLVRHYRVMDDTTKLWMTSSEFARWVAHYNECEVECLEPAVDDAEWEACYASDLPRAVKTAEKLYARGNLSITKLLREIETGPLFPSRWKLHRSLWLILGRLGWLVNHASQEPKAGTYARARAILDQLESNGHGNILVVTHGAFMTVLRRELRRRGFEGDKFLKPRNGKVYLFRKKASIGLVENG